MFRTLLHRALWRYSGSVSKIVVEDYDSGAEAIGQTIIMSLMTAGFGYGMLSAVGGHEPAGLLFTVLLAVFTLTAGWLTLTHAGAAFVYATEWTETVAVPEVSD